jgi:hypothetical protein
LTGTCRLDRRRGAIRGVERPSDGAGAARASDGGERPAAGEARRRAAASGGARRNRGWGAPTCTGIAPKRRTRACESTGGPHGRRRRRTTAPGEARRRRTTGDGVGGGAAHGEPNQLHRWAPHLEAKRGDGSNSMARRRRRGLTARTEAGTAELGTARLGLGFGARARGFGCAARGGWRRLK